MEKLKLFYDAFRKGQSLSDPVMWKQRQIDASLLAAFLGACLALGKAFGYDLPLTSEELLHIAGAIIAIYGLCNAGLTMATSTKIGLPSRDLPVEPETEKSCGGGLPPCQRMGSDSEAGVRIKRLPKNGGNRRK